MIARYARLSMLAALAIAGVMLISGMRPWERDEGRLPAANARVPAVTATPTPPAGAETPHGAAAPGATPDPIVAIQATLEQDPKNAGAWRDLGRLLAQRKDYPGAAEAFAAALEVTPDDARLRNDLGSALLYLGLVRVARAQFERSVTLDGTYPDARFNLAISLSHVQPPDTDRALQEWRRVVEMVPDTEVGKLAQRYIDEYTGATKRGATPSATSTPTKPGSD